MGLWNEMSETALGTLGWSWGGNLVWLWKWGLWGAWWVTGATAVTGLQPLWWGSDCQSGSRSGREVPLTYLNHPMDDLTPLFFKELLSSLYLTL